MPDEAQYPLVDIEIGIQCPCDAQLQIRFFDSGEKTCQECGREYRVAVTVDMKTPDGSWREIYGEK